MCELLKLKCWNDLKSPCYLSRKDNTERRFGHEKSGQFNKIFMRPVEAGAVLQKPPSLFHWSSHWSISSNSSKHH